MTLRELREIIEPNTLLWIETPDEEYLEAGEEKELTRRYDTYTVKEIYIYHIKSMFAWGIIVQVEKGEIK